MAAGIILLLRDRMAMAETRKILAAGYSSDSLDPPEDAPAHAWFLPLWRAMVACRSNSATILDAFAVFDNIGVALALMPKGCQARAVAAGVKPAPMTVARASV